MIDNAALKIDEVWDRIKAMPKDEQDAYLTAMGEASTKAERLIEAGAVDEAIRVTSPYYGAEESTKLAHAYARIQGIDVPEFSKVIRVGTVQPYGGRWAAIYCKVEYKESRRAVMASNGQHIAWKQGDPTGRMCLSITGVIGPLQSGNALGGCGQIAMEFAHRNPRHNDARYTHLIQPDDIRFAPGWDGQKWQQFLTIWKLWHLNTTNAECVHQHQLGWTWATHPSEPCPVCGYKMGSAWLHRDVPQPVLRWLLALPDADKTPAWV